MAKCICRNTLWPQNQFALQIYISQSFLIHPAYWKIKCNCFGFGFGSRLSFLVSVVAELIDFAVTATVIENIC